MRPHCLCRLSKQIKTNQLVVKYTMFNTLCVACVLPKAEAFSLKLQDSTSSLDSVGVCRLFLLTGV